MGNGFLKPGIKGNSNSDLAFVESNPSFSAIEEETMAHSIEW